MTYKSEMKAVDEKIADARRRLSELKRDWNELRTEDAIRLFGVIEEEIRVLRSYRHSLYPRQRAKSYFDLN